jgi:hypothetical protein
MRSPSGSEVRGRVCLAVMAAFLPMAVPLQGCFHEEKSREKEEKVTDCPIDAGPCVGKVDNLEVSFEITPRPVRTMTELVFRVEALSEGVSLDDGEVAVDLAMPGMVMAENRVILTRLEVGIYEGRGVIVRCSSGGKDWKATVFSSSIPHLAFAFRVDQSP